MFPAAAAGLVPLRAGRTSYIRTGMNFSAEEGEMSGRLQVAPARGPRGLRAATATAQWPVTCCWRLRFARSPPQASRWLRCPSDSGGGGGGARAAPQARSWQPPSVRVGAGVRGRQLRRPGGEGGGRGRSSPSPPAPPGSRCSPLPCLASALAVPPPRLISRLGPGWGSAPLMAAAWQSHAGQAAGRPSWP